MIPLRKIVTSVQTPLLYLNLAGLAGGAVWLGVLGQWQVIWIGMAALFAPFFIPILMIPAGILSHFMALYRDAGRKERERLMFVLTLAYILSFLTLWCVSVFSYVTANVRADAIGAALLWADSVALAPLLMWAGRDRKNVFIMTTVEVAQLAILALSLLRLSGCGAQGFWPSFAIFGGIMVFAAAAQAIYEARFLKSETEGR